jgi:hypothetical protein
MVNPGSNDAMNFAALDSKGRIPETIEAETGAAGSPRA